MRNFILGAVVILLLLLLGGLAIATLGLLPTSADSAPPKLESRVAMSAVDASVERRAPHVTNPVPPTDDNLIDGMKIYTMNCAGCHGNLDNKPSPFGASFYPPAPQLIIHPVDDPDWRTYYVVRTGIRYTGMPAWNKVLSEQEMWKVTAFVSRIEKLSPAVQDYWKKSIGVAPPPVDPQGNEHEHHD
jgi:thiosulfate dehydrogenase